ARPSHRAGHAGRGEARLRQRRLAGGHLRPAPGAERVSAAPPAAPRARRRRFFSERLRAIFWKEFIQMRRDKATLRMMLGVPVQVLVDATDPTASQAAIGAAQLVGQTASVEILRARTGATIANEAPPIDVRVRPLYNPALKNALFMVPGIIGALLSNMLIITT